MYPFRSANVPLGVHVPQVGNPCCRPWTRGDQNAKCGLREHFTWSTALVSDGVVYGIKAWITLLCRSDGGFSLLFPLCCNVLRANTSMGGPVANKLCFKDCVDFAGLTLAIKNVGRNWRLLGSFTWSNLFLLKKFEHLWHNPYNAHCNSETIWCEQKVVGCWYCIYSYNKISCSWSCGKWFLMFFHFSKEI